MSRIKCWLTRHHWLLQGELPTHIYADNGQTAKGTDAQPKTEVTHEHNEGDGHKH